MLMFSSAMSSAHFDIRTRPALLSVNSRSLSALPGENDVVTSARRLAATHKLSAEFCGDCCLLVPVVPWVWLLSLWVVCSHATAQPQMPSGSVSLCTVNG